MTPDSVRTQLNDLIGRLIKSNLAVSQFYPSIRFAPEGDIMIARRASSSIALKNVAYEDVYRELDRNQAFDVKLIDGGLLLFQYHFKKDESLHQHRLAYFPCPVLPTVDDAPALYEYDELYGDVVAKNLVRFPIRFDYAPDDAVDLLHPKSHLTLGQYENCRIPVTGPMTPASFGNFIVRNFYHRNYLRNKNVFDKRHRAMNVLSTITASEKMIAHFVGGR